MRVHESQCIRAAKTKHHGLGGLCHRNLFLTVLEVGSPKSRHWQIPCLLRAHAPVHGRCLLAVSSCGGRGEGSLWGPLHKGINPIHEGSALMTESPPIGSVS